jgi:hypothetical protein
MSAGASVRPIDATRAMALPEALAAEFSSAAATLFWSRWGLNGFVM